MQRKGCVHWFIGIRYLWFLAAVAFDCVGMVLVWYWHTVTCIVSAFPWTIATLATVRGFLIMFASLNLKVGSSLCG